MQCFFRASLCTFITENAFRSVFSLTRLFIDFYIHGADLQALAAMDALILVTVDTQKRKIAHRLEEHRDGTEILAKSPIILENQGQCDTLNVIERISGEEQSEHDLLQICDLHQKQPGHQYQGQNEHHIAENTNFFFSWLLRLLIG